MSPEEETMHATLAFLNAAGRRTADPTPNNRAFMRVMNTLLAIVPSSLLAAPRRKLKSKGAAVPKRVRSEAGGQ
jgi:hypothetical protein